MADKSDIEWTDATWNPIVGCSIISPACTNCYAMGMAARLEKMMPAVQHGAVLIPSHYSALTQSSKAGPVWTGRVTLAPDHIITKPLHWKRQRKIFVNSMGDLFHESVPDEWIDLVFAVMALCPQHTFQILTKRARRMREYLKTPLRRDAWSLAIDPGITSPLLSIQEFANRSHVWVSTPTYSCGYHESVFSRWPLPNVWLGVTAEDQTRADDRIPDLLATPSAKRFISAEPLLGPIDVRWALGTPVEIAAGFLARGHFAPGLETLRPLDQIITGGESGPNARPSHPDWFRSLRDQCAVARVPFFFKQWGEWGEPLDTLGALDWPYHKDHDRTHWFDARECVRPIERGWDDKYHHGHCRALDPAVNLWETPEYLDQVGRCPQASCRKAAKCQGNEARAAVVRVGKRRAGAMLDGREHKDFPA